MLRRETPLFAVYSSHSQLRVTHTHTESECVCVCGEREQGTTAVTRKNEVFTQIKSTPIPSPHRNREKKPGLGS